MSNTTFAPIGIVDLEAVTGGEARNTGITCGMTGINNKVPDSAFPAAAAAPAASQSRTTSLTNAAKGFAGGLACLGKFAVDGTPGTNSYDTYLACQRAAHQF